MQNASEAVSTTKGKDSVHAELEVMEDDTQEACSTSWKRSRRSTGPGHSVSATVTSVVSG